MAKLKNRFCIICAPRTGSQWCAKLIEEAVGSFDLGEFFEIWNNSEFIVDNGSLKLKEFKQTKKVPFGINSKYNDRLNLLREADPSQPLTIRLFLFDKYPKDVFKKIILELYKLNFTFITLERNLKDQLLSFIIARLSTNMLNKNFFTINTLITESIDIKINENLQRTLEHIFKSKQSWNENINYFLENIPYHTVNYESMVVDMEKILNKKLLYVGTKSIQGDPLFLIKNKTEVVEYLNKNFLEVM